MRDILLIIPAFNEESSIVRTVERVREFNRGQKRKVHYIVIDDGSTDRTPELLRRHRIPMIRISTNSGIGIAVQRGYKYAFAKGYRYAVQFDGDGQHGIEYIYDVIAPLERGEADMVIGSRYAGLSGGYMPGMIRKIGISWISLLIRMKTGANVKDPTSGYRAVGATGIRVYANAYPAKYPEPVSCARFLLAGWRVAEVPVKMHKRTGGRSSISSWRKLEYMFLVSFGIIMS
ncbi:MAG: glycosyltransferase family 2 protein [Lachnospiraceae bacterium]|nr:glycosyltransferase family 2 protein [Lachnospiraceae bacterium]